MIANFLKQINDNPEDLFLREVFGDWLEENGHDREDAWGFPLVSMSISRYGHEWGRGYGIGRGIGIGHGNGSGNGCGIGHGCVNGIGHGNGSGYGHGHGNGYRIGIGYGN